eukprot:6194470-Pleurochrysis_carterae.AAC.1
MATLKQARWPAKPKSGEVGTRLEGSYRVLIEICLKNGQRMGNRLSEPRAWKLIGLRPSSVNNRVAAMMQIAKRIEAPILIHLSLSAMDYFVMDFARSP